MDPEKTEKKAFRIENDALALANRLEQKRIAAECSRWLRDKVDVRSIIKPGFLHGKMYHTNNCQWFDSETDGGRNMSRYSDLLTRAIRYNALGTASCQRCRLLGKMGAFPNRITVWLIVESLRSGRPVSTFAISAQASEDRMAW